MSDLQPTRSRSTLNDVAQAAGVSASTVSLVLAGKADARRISGETHRRVRAAAADLGYTPNLLHRSLRKGRTNLISFYNAYRNRERKDLFMNRLSAGLEYAGGRHGYDVLVHCNFQRSQQETYEFLNGGLTDGLILFGAPFDDPLLDLLRGSSLPTVLINPRANESVLSFVEDDVDRGMELLAEALVSQGHQQVAAVIDGSRLSNPRRRIDRLQRELNRLGAELKESDILAYHGDAASVAEQLSELPSKPTAVFVWHDRLAYAILEGCEQVGTRVPQELSIVSYDGIVWPSTSPHTTTSIEVSLDDLADAAVSLLDRLIQGEPGPIHQTISVCLKPGTTLGPAPQS